MYARESMVHASSDDLFHRFCRMGPRIHAQHCKRMDLSAAIESKRQQAWTRIFAYPRIQQLLSIALEMEAQWQRQEDGDYTSMEPALPSWKLFQMRVLLNLFHGMPPTLPPPLRFKKSTRAIDFKGKRMGRNKRRVLRSPPPRFPWP
ncbi:unnamed protein product [Aphanomyces euteiches]